MQMQLFSGCFPSSLVDLYIIRDQNLLYHVLHVHFYCHRLKPLAHILLGTSPEINIECVHEYESSRDADVKSTLMFSFLGCLCVYEGFRK